MNTVWLDSEEKYDGSQLAPLYNYLNHGVLGDSVVSWKGACDIPFENMIDGEDVLAKSTIAGKEMIHFIFELFQLPLSTAVAMQRLLGELLILKISALSSNPVDLRRSGDDVYWGEKKLNISIATCSQTSSLIHYGVNFTNAGTPVETCSLKDFGIVDPEEFSRQFMDDCKHELLSLRRAMVKVRTF